MSGTSSERVEGEYEVSEIFYSVQGEGLNAGRAAFFVRLSGCNLNCSFCDTPQRNSGQWMRRSSIHQKLSDLADVHRVNLFSAGLVITGGEPTLQIDKPLLDLASMFQWCDIETNGTNPLGPELAIPGYKRPPNVRISVCPKSLDVLAEMMVDASQIKLLVPSPFPIDEALTFLIAWKTLGCAIFLQPLDEKDEEKNRCNLDTCLAMVKKHPWLRLSVQLHKLLAFR